MAILGCRRCCDFSEFGTHLLSSLDVGPVAGDDLFAFPQARLDLNFGLSLHSELNLTGFDTIFGRYDQNLPRCLITADVDGKNRYCEYIIAAVERESCLGV